MRTWAAVRVGDVVRVPANLELFPADLLCLGSSGGPQCWVNTKPLDGETDVKLRVVPPAAIAAVGAERLGDAQALGEALRGKVRCEEPNDKVNEFIAQLQLDGRARALVSEDNMLLRGCQLRNADWVRPARFELAIS
jgi:magnesium-transporting ATPase (P-type)